MHTSNDSVSLILPAWNEEEVIEAALSEAEAALGELACDYEIIVVDDGSTDSTSNLVNQIIETHPRVRLIRHQHNIGYGAALRAGFQAATKQLVAFTDADCQFDLKELDRFRLLSQSYDIVCGYRIDRQDTALRCFYSRVYNQLVRCLLGTGVRDVDCALKMFRRDVVQDFNITTDGFLVNSELLTQAKQRGHSIVEVGVSHRPRTQGQSTVSIRHIPNVFKSLLQFWWNKVQFPGTAIKTTSDESPAENRKLAAYQICLLLIAALFMLSNLSYPLIDRDETRYAEVPREMIATGNWILPQLNFQPYYDKPPLLYWLCAVSYTVFGVSEWSARLVPALAALLTLAAIMWFGNRWFGRRVGMLSGVVLMLSAGFVFCSRYLLIDGVLMALETFSLLCAFESLRGRKVKTGWWLASAICCGLACLAKGPIALVLWLPPVFTFAWLSESHARPKLLHYTMLLGVVAAIAAPWLMLVTRQDDQFLKEFFLTHNLRRFAGEFHAEPIWYFIPVLLIAGHPWCYLTISFSRFLFTHRNPSQAQRPQELGFLVLWSGWCFVFFSLSKCKLPTYLLPAAPAFALMIGYYLGLVMSDAKITMSYLARCWSARAATVSTATAAIGFLFFLVATQQQVSMVTYGWALLWTTILVGSALLFREQRKHPSAWWSSAIVAGLFSMMMMHHLLPAYSRDQTLFGAGSPMLRELATTPHVATLGHEFSDVPYYLNRSDIPHWNDLNSTGLTDFLRHTRESLLVINDSVAIDQLRSCLPGHAAATVIADQGRARLVKVVIKPLDSQVALHSNEDTANANR